MSQLINNRYRVAKELGAGGMGTVYLAEDTLNNGQMVALKMIRADLLGERNLAQFKYEFAAMAQLRHPNLVEVYDFGTFADSKEYFFTMEYVSGEDLPTLASRYYAAGLLDFSWLYEIAVQVCRALQYIHSRGFIHYDVKPRNIRLMPNGQVKLMDFGLIGQARGEGQLRLRGTPEYIAPELIRGDSVDHRADLYSLGVSLYEIVTGSLPYKDESSTTVLRQHVEEAITLPADVAEYVPDALQQLIRRLLDKAPARRYGSANEVIREINALTSLNFPVETRETKRGYIQSGAFVGRDFELARLQGLLMRMVQGQGRLVLISGAAGVGKTRLVREVRLRAQMQRVLVCEGACHEHARTPYRPWIAIFKQMIAYHRTSNPELLQEYGPALVQLMPELFGALGITGAVNHQGMDKQRLLECAADFLIAPARPLMLILEDMHYADAETVELLDYMGQRAQEARLLLVAAYRDDEIDRAHPLNTLVGQSRFVNARDSRTSTSGTEHPYELLSLNLLTEQAVADLLHSMLGIGRAADTTALASGLLPRLMDESGGNPLFIESLMHSLVEEDLLQYDGEAWRVDLDGLNRTPVSIQESALRRLSRLEARSLELLRWAAVMGQWLDFDLLADITDLPPDTLFGLVQEAVRRHVLVTADRAGEIAYRFSNDQMRLAIYNTLPVQERARRHTTIGEALRERYPESEVVELLAWHFEQAGQFDRALRYAKIAGDKARRVYANESAIHYYSLALDFSRAEQATPKPNVVYAILAGREEAYKMVGDRQAQIADLEEMAQLAAAMGDVSRQVEVVTRQVALASQLGNQAEARSTAEAALELARQAEDPKLEAESLTSLGIAIYQLGDPEAAYAAHTEALAIFRALGDPSGEANNLWRLGSVCRMLGKIDEAEAHMQAALPIYRMLNNRPGEADALNALGTNARDAALQRDYYEQSLDIARMIGDRHRLSRAYNNLALVYWSLGLYDRARDYIDPAVQIQRDMQGRAVLANYMETLGRVYFDLGEYLLAQQYYEEGRAISRDIGNPAAESIYWYGLGRVAQAREHPAQARDLIEVACQMQREGGIVVFLYTSLAWMGEVHLALDDWPAADRYTREAVEVLDKLGGGTGEFPRQEVWWLRYRVLKADPDAPADTLSDDAWAALQTAYHEMLTGIETLSDEGLRRNYLNKVQINRDIVNEWTRQLKRRGDSAVLDEIASAVMVERDETAEMARMRDKLKRVLDISVRMNETHDAASLLNFVMDQVIELSGAERGFLVLLDEEGQFDFKVALGIAMEELERAQAEVSYTVLGSVAQSRQPVLLQDALTDERFGAQSSVLELNLRSVLCVPLLSGSELIGMIYADNRSVSGRFSQADLDMMMIFANQAATAIENANLYEGLVVANRELEAWTRTLEERVEERTAALQTANAVLSRRAVQLETSNQVGQQATSILGLDDLLPKVVELIQTQFGYYFVGVWLLNEADNTICLRAGTGSAGQKMLDTGFTVSLDARSVIGAVCRTGQYRLVDDVTATGDFLRVEALPDVASELALPLRMGERAFGVLNIASDRRAAFGDEDRVVLESLAAQIAIAIRNAQLYESEQQRRQLAELLEEAGRALTSSLDMSEVPGSILDLLASLMPYTRGVVMIQQGERLKTVAQRGFPDDARAQDIEMPIREGDVYQQLARKGQPIIIHDVTQEQGWQQVDWLPLNRSWLGVPLIAKDHIIGMISLTRKEARAFGDEEATWVQAFAAQAGIALENARLYAEITRFNEKLEQMVAERTEELNRAYENLEQLDKTKSDFIDVAAHELRTPLTVIKGYTQILRTNAAVQAEESLERVIEGILAGSDRMHEIVNSMLDVAKIDSQALKMVKEFNKLHDIIQRVHIGFMTSLRDRDLTLTIADVEALPPVLSDADLIYKVFYQLITNAIKYTPDGGRITIQGRDYIDANGEPMVEVAIIDTGIGIDPEQQELIFEKFYQTGELEFHSSGKTKFKGGGPGLGLAIARGIMLAHGGDITVESEGCDEEVCPGSSFYVRLPVGAESA